MKKNHSLFFLFVAILSIFSLAQIDNIYSAGTDAKTIVGEAKDLPLCPQCTVTWNGAAQAVRFTLVRRSDGERVPGTISVDYSNQYENVKWFSNVYFSGFNSKLDYLENKSLINNLTKGYSVKRPIGPLPNLVGENSTKVGDMEAYLKNTFVYFDGYPTNLVRLLNDVNVNKESEDVQKVLDQINYNFDIYDEYDMKKEMSTEDWKNIFEKHDFAFIAEPVVFLNAKTGELAPDYISNVYYGKTFAVTPTEAALIFPNDASDCVTEDNNGKGVCQAVTHTILPNALYLEGTEAFDVAKATYFNGLKTQFTVLSDPIFGNESTASIFLDDIKKAKTGERLIPYFLTRDVIGESPNGNDLNRKSPGIGIGYFDLIGDIYERCYDGCCGQKCDPIDIVNTCDDPSQNKNDIPTCRVGGCGSTISLTDDQNWDNIVGDKDHLDSTIGSNYLVTTWEDDEDLLDYETLSCKALPLAAVYCKQIATSSFPSTPDNKLYAGTHFLFEPVSFNIRKDCMTEIDLETWQKDYIETEKRKRVAEISLARARVMSNFWDGVNASEYDDITDNNIDVTFNGVTGRLAGATHCGIKWSAPVSKEPTSSTQKVVTCTYKTPIGITLEVNDFSANKSAVTGGSVIKPNALNQYKLTMDTAKNTCLQYKSARDVQLDEFGEILIEPGVPPMYKWVAATPSKSDPITKDASYTCTVNYKGANLNIVFTGPGTFFSQPNDNIPTVPGDFRVTLSDSYKCLYSIAQADGVKWEDWSYIFRSEALGADLIIDGIDYPINNFVDGEWPMTDTTYEAFCKGSGDYSSVVEEYSNAVEYYTNRLAQLKNELSLAMNWEVKTNAPSISATQKQNTLGGTITKTYNLRSSGTSVFESTLTKTECLTTLCESVKDNSELEKVYTLIYGSQETLYTYRLPSGTNQYILKPSGDVVSTLPGSYLLSGNYIDIGYPNYYIASNSLNGMGSGSITLKYSGLGQNNYFDTACSYSDYTCSYQGEYTAAFKYVYRTIDLNNPFPYNDGTARQPGYNWRSDPTYISDVITNNRDVTTDQVYKVTPMYSFDFTGDNQKKLAFIKAYNKSHSFADYDLTCTEGHECISAFLDLEMFTNVITGCAKDGDVSKCNKEVINP